MRKSGLQVFVGALVVLVARTAAAAGGFTVDQVLADLNLPADAAARIRRGEMVHSDPKKSSEREMAVGLTFRMRVLSSPSIIEPADRVARVIIETYLAPNKTFRDVREILDDDAMNPLREFCNAFREELRRRGSS